MAACHLIADGELTLLGDIAADNLVYAGCELIAVLAGELFDLDDNAVFAVGDLEGGVSDLLGLLAEYRAEKSLLGSQLGLALGRYFTDKDIAGVNFAPTRIMPRSSRLLRRSSETFGISLVISSGPSFVSLASISCFSM